MALSRLSRMLLSGGDTSDIGCGGDPYAILTEEVSHHDSDEAFIHVYYVMLFIASLWFAGKLFMKFGMPALVGEIVFGIIMGPHLLNLAGDHGSEFLIVIGEIGLVMLVVEAGIDVDIGMLKLIGPRGLGIALMGSVVPMAMGVVISYLMGTTIGQAIAIGACFAPTSMGIALNVLKKAKILNTPTGQLIIAAAILDDVIALIILSELTAMKDPTAINILLPLIVSPVLIVGIGYLAIRWIPKWIKVLMSKVPKEHRENSILALLFCATFVMVPLCHFLGSSHLLGAFLAGLCFCTDHTIHHVWDHQIKRVLSWMLRVFFAATIGFAIPIQEFANVRVITRGLIYCVCDIGKIVQGFFSRPLNKKEFFTVGWSMSAWGEFAFILATASYAEGTIDKESFSAVLLAVLLSVIISPYALSFNLKYYEKKQQELMDAHLKKYEDTNLHPLYFAINTKARGQWGHQDKILHKIFNLQLEIIDFRSWHAPEYNHSHHKPLTKESFYVQDMITALPPTKHLDSHEKQQLMDRVKTIRNELTSALGEKAVINIKRWLPGVTKRDDQLEPADAYTASMFGGEYKPNHCRQKTAEYCRREAFKQAHSIMSVFERKATLEDIAMKQSQRSKLRLMSDSTVNGVYGTADTARKGTIEQFEKDMAEKSISFTESHDPQKTHKFHSDPNINIIDTNNGNLSRKHSIKKTHRRTSSNPASPIGTTKSSNWSANRARNRRHMMRHINHSGAGHSGRAGGAGALPVTNKTINIHDHWDNPEESLVNSGIHQSPRNQSYMSYIYGDEDSHHHKLPEYSLENLPEYALEIFQPKLPGLAEDNIMNDNNNGKFNENEDKVRISFNKPVNNEDLSAHDESSIKTDENYSKTDQLSASQHSVINKSGAEPQIVNLTTHHEPQRSISIGKDTKKNKLTIKIYPPALKAVPSRSPVASDAGSPDQYLE